MRIERHYEKRGPLWTPNYDIRRVPDLWYERIPYRATTPTMVANTGQSGFNTGTSHTDNYLTAPTLGNTLVAGGFVNDNNTGSTFFSDDQSNTWVTIKLTGLNGGVTTLCAGYALNISAVPVVVNLNTTSSVVGCISQLGEVNNVNSFDNSVTRSSSGSSFNGATYTNATAVEMIISVFLYLAGDASAAITSPFVKWGNPNSNNFGIGGYQAVNSISTYTCNATGSSTSWGNITFGLYQSGGGGATPRLRTLTGCGI